MIPTFPFETIPTESTAPFLAEPDQFCDEKWGHPPVMFAVTMKNGKMGPSTCRVRCKVIPRCDLRPPRSYESTPRNTVAGGGRFLSRPRHAYAQSQDGAQRPISASTWFVNGGPAANGSHFAMSQVFFKGRCRFSLPIWTDSSLRIRIRNMLGTSSGGGAALTNRLFSGTPDSGCVRLV